MRSPARRHPATNCDEFKMTGGGRSLNDTACYPPWFRSRCTSRHKALTARQATIKLRRKLGELFLHGFHLQRETQRDFLNGATGQMGSRESAHRFLEVNAVPDDSCSWVLACAAKKIYRPMTISYLGLYSLRNAHLGVPAW